MERMEIKQLIAKGETEKAISALMAIASERQNNELEKQAINLSGQFSALEKKIKSFTITSSNASARIAQLNSILLDIVNDLEELGPVENGVSTDDEEAVGILTEEDVNSLEQQQILERLQKIMKRRKFFQDQFDISSDASQKFNLQENIELMDQDITILKGKLGADL